MPRVTLDRQMDYNRRISGYFRPGVFLSWTELVKLAQQEKINKTTLSRYLKRLERDGLIKREVDPTTHPPRTRYSLSRSSIQTLEDPMDAGTLAEIAEMGARTEAIARWKPKNLLEYADKVKNLHLTGKELPPLPPLFVHLICNLASNVATCVIALRHSPDNMDQAITEMRSRMSSWIEGFLKDISRQDVLFTRDPEVYTTGDDLPYGMRHRDDYLKAALAFLSYIKAIGLRRSQDSWLEMDRKWANLLYKLPDSQFREKPLM